MFNLFKLRSAVKLNTSSGERPSVAYRKLRADTAVPEMIGAIKNVKWMTTLVLVVGLVALYGHQADFLVKMVGKLGLLVPGVVDLGMLAMMVQAQTTAMKREAKRRAIRVFLGLTAVSVVFNVLASLPHTEFLAELGWLIEAVVFAVIVGVVGAVKWAATAIDADFSALEEAEAEAAAPAPVVVTVAGCTHPTTCTTAAQCARKTASAATRKANKAAAAAATQAKKDARRAREADRKQAAADAADAAEIARKVRDAEAFAEVAMLLDGERVEGIAPMSPAHATKFGN